jgi:thymidylate synthase
MYLVAKTVDDLLHRVFSKLLKHESIKTKHKGGIRETTGALLKLSNPRARFSRTNKKSTLSSCLGELLWYLSGSNNADFIVHYVKHYKEFREDDGTVYGGYGPRLLNMDGVNQIENVITLLRENPTSRRAAIQLFRASDIIKRQKEIPCTCTMQFLSRGGRLHMMTYMRSNDAFVGLPHDIFAFTMIQEIIARSLDLELGVYNHAVGSLHLYDANELQAREYLDEGYQATTRPMPPMPVGDPWQEIKTVLNLENLIRSGTTVSIKTLGLTPYWKDLLRILQAYQYILSEEPEELAKIKKDMHSKIFNAYLDKKQRVGRRK